MTDYDIGILESSVNSQNNYTVTSRAPTDVFEFDLDRNGTINLHLHNISRGDDVDLYLYQDSNGNGRLDRQDTQIAYSYNANNASETITQAATAGTYFAKVKYFSGRSAQYDLDLSTTYASSSPTPSSGSSSSSSSSSGSGLIFNFTYEGDGSGASKVSQQQMVAFEMAGQIWSQYLDDDMTVNIHIDVTDDLPENIIGGAIPGFAAEQYSDLRSNLYNNATSTDDSIAVSNMDEAALNSRTRVDRADGIEDWMTTTNSTIHLTRANLKATDSLASVHNDSALDGYILMSNLSNSSYHWHYDAYDTQGNNSEVLNADEVDFLSVAVHEIGHILGFVSGVDFFSSEWEMVYTSPIFQEDNGQQEIINNLMDLSTVLDVFRYAPSVADSGIGNDFSIGGNPFFSINGGSSPLGQFANGRSDEDWLVQKVDGGLDGYQASHWEMGSAGVMVPAIYLGERNTISSGELVAFDVLGFDRTSGFSAPNYANLYQSAQSAVFQYDSNRTTQSQLDDVLAMIDASPMYEGRRSSRTTRWQEVLDVFAQEALNSTFDEDAWQAYVESITLKEAGTAGEDKMNGNIGGDRLRGLENNDILKGYEGDDLLKGNQGGDRILGGEGNDTLIGGNGNDIIKGEAGDDLLKGGAGLDVLVGGEGADTFVIDNTAGFNIIRDFVAGEDLLQLTTGGDVTVSQRNNHTTITSTDNDANLLAVLRNVNPETVIFE